MSNFATTNANGIRVNPLFLRHDLMIELGRLEMALEDVASEPNNQPMRNQIETRCAKINEALSRLPA